MTTEDKTEPKKPVDDRSESERQRDAEIERLDTFFAALQPGVTLLIERLKPSWCAGLLEEITIQKDEEVGLDYFIETWGGEVLSVKIRGAGGRLSGSYKIHLASYPPMLLGEPLRKHDRREIFQTKDSDAMVKNQPVVVNPSNAVEKVVQAIPALIPVVTAWMQHAETRRKEEQQHRDNMMIQMMRMNSSSGIGDITKIGAAMGQLQQIFAGSGGLQGGGEGQDNMEFLPQALDVLKMVLSPGEQNNEQKTATSHRLAPPRAVGSPPPASVPKVTQLKQPNIAKSISDMDPEVAANTVMDSLALMPPDKQAIAFAHLRGQYLELMGNNDRGDEDDYDDDQERGVQ
jgi:hypothetical protein